MRTEEDEKIIEAMEKFGGSFIKALANCFRRADINNFMILKYAFAIYWETYKEMTKL